MHLNWHPFLRLNSEGQFRTVEHGYRPLTAILADPAPIWSDRVTCFKTRPLGCTLLVGRDAEHQVPWFILTDLPPETARMCWYGLRAWIESGFKDFKRGGWQWQYTRITDPARAERFWLILAVATLWMVSVGGAAEMTLPASSLDELPVSPITPQPRRHQPPRWLSCFRRGRLVILAAFITGQPLPRGRFQSEPWPEQFANGKTCP